MITDTPCDSGTSDEEGILLASGATKDVTIQTVTVAFIVQGYTDNPSHQATAKQGVDLAATKLLRAKRGFMLSPQRWVVECDFGWKS